MMLYIIKYVIIFTYDGIYHINAIVANPILCFNMEIFMFRHFVWKFFSWILSTLSAPINIAICNWLYYCQILLIPPLSWLTRNNFPSTYQFMLLIFFLTHFHNPIPSWVTIDEFERCDWHLLLELFPMLICFGGQAFPYFYYSKLSQDFW